MERKSSWDPKEGFRKYAQRASQRAEDEGCRKERRAEIPKREERGGAATKQREDARNERRKGKVVRNASRREPKRHRPLRGSLKVKKPQPRREAGGRRKARKIAQSVSKDLRRQVPPGSEDITADGNHRTKKNGGDTGEKREKGDGEKEGQGQEEEMNSMWTETDT